MVLWLEKMNQAREREAYLALSLFEDLLPAPLVHWQLKALVSIT